MSSEIRTVLETAKKNNNLVALYRDELPVNEYTGFVVTLGKKLVILHRDSDFTLDGYVALRVDDVTYTEQVDDNKFMKRVLEGERLYAGTQTPKLTTAESWNELLSGVQASFGGWLTAETYSEDGQCFFLGVISRLDSNFLYLCQVDALGNKRAEETTIALQDLVTVTFGGRYLNIYRKYTR